MILAAIIAAALILLVAVPLIWLHGRHVGHETGYQLGYDHGHDMGRAETLGAAEDVYRRYDRDIDELRAENYDLEQRLAACASAVHALPGGAR